LVMEATMTLGVWTSIVVSGMLVIPIILEFCKRNLPICFGLLTTLLTIYCLAPYSAGAREVWTPISKIPAELVQTINELVSLSSTEHSEQTAQKTK
jgi:hypothetical protein